MKIYISNYRYHWISPFKIAEKLCFWRDIEYDEKWVRRLNTLLYPVMSKFRDFLDTIHPRVEYIKIDKYDTWGMDTTLALIIVPMLKQLKATKHGVPYDLTEAEWNVILDEMIWAFNEISTGLNEDEFFDTGIDWDGLKVYNERIDNGTALFGKYYRALWD